MKIKAFTAAIAICMISNSAYCGTFKEAKYDVCFTPGDDCTALISETIALAKHTVLVQAYSFTSKDIAQAIVDAHKRGIDVRVILDKSQFSQKYSSSKFLMNHNIPVWEDATVKIAHNKVIIIDGQTVITGSFNFTKAAQSSNAENVIIITDKELASRYMKNWSNRKEKSELIKPS